MMKDLLLEEIFGMNKHFSADVIYNDTVHTQCSTADSTGKQTQR